MLPVPTVRLVCMVCSKPFEMLSTQFDFVVRYLEMRGATADEALATARKTGTCPTCRNVKH